MEDTTLPGTLPGALLVGPDATRMRDWTSALLDAGMFVGSLPRSRLASRPIRLGGAEVSIAIDACGQSTRELLDDLAAIEAWSSEARIVVATDDATAAAVRPTASVTWLKPPVGGERLVAALRERRAPLPTSAVTDLDRHVSEALASASPALSPQMRVVVIMASLNMSVTEMSDALGVSERTVLEYAKQGRVRLRWRSRSELLRQVAAAQGWSITALLTRLTGDEDVARRISRVVDPPPVDPDRSRPTRRI